jgi:cytochrome c5
MKQWPFLGIVLLLALLPACGPATTISPTPIPTEPPPLVPTEAPSPAPPEPTNTPTVAPTEEPTAIPFDGQALLDERCTVCHSLSRVENAKHSLEEWRATVERMIDHGAILTPEEASALVDYLAQTYPE